MPNFFYKTLYFESFTYVTDTTPQLLTGKLEVLFNEKQGWFKSPNLKGEFLEYPAIFSITPKRWLVQIRGGEEREPAKLSGIISSLNTTQTKIDIVVKPNAVYRLLFFVCLPFAVFIIIKSLLTMEFHFSLLGPWPFVFGLFFLFISAKNAATKLRNNFEKYLNITPVDIKNGQVNNE
ncbi:hypothetical protein [Ferruginibacter sp. SUN106]|uniref:hypothetical protein n=1 Tax=Ferruginibacter sp. SUN106 TaxID=2978348 RepID=UPI003D35D989